jgi:hypothetical protein
MPCIHATQISAPDPVGELESQILRLRLSLKEKDAEVEAIRAATIEECAKVADAILSDPKSSGREIAKAIRSLSKEK